MTPFGSQHLVAALDPRVRNRLMVPTNPAGMGDVHVAEGIRPRPAATASGVPVPKGRPAFRLDPEALRRALMSVPTAAGPAQGDAAGGP